MKTLGSTYAEDGSTDLIVVLRLNSQEAANLGRLVGPNEPALNELERQTHAEVRQALLEVLELQPDDKFSDSVLMLSARAQILNLRNRVRALPKDKRPLWTEERLKESISHLVVQMRRHGQVGDFPMVDEAVVLQFCLEVVESYEQWLHLSLDYATWDAALWAAQEFKDQTQESKTWHLLEECVELLKSVLSKSPDMVLELGDVQILLAGIAQLSGVDLADATRTKLAINRSREYGPADAQGISHHKKTHDSDSGHFMAHDPISDIPWAYNFRMEPKKAKDNE